MSHFHTFTKRAILGLTALTVALALLVSAACSGNEMNPTPPTDRGDQTLVEEINRLKSETASLRQEVEELRSAESQETTQRTVPSVTQPARTPETTAARQQTTTEPAPTRVTIPAPDGPGICGRSPEIQKAILERLDINLCQVVNAAEMFRITGLPELRMDTVRTGDFAGLVNVKGLAVDLKNLETQSLTGLESLQELRLNIKNEGTITGGALQGLLGLEKMELTIATDSSIEPGAFHGLSGLETLVMHFSDTTSEQYTFVVPDLDSMPNLTHIRIEWFETKTESSTPFHNLPSLESAEISIGFRNEEPEGKEFQIHHNMFANNPKLKNIQLNVWAPEKMKINIPVDLFSNNPLLEEIKINSEGVRLPRDLFKHLEELKQLDLHEYWTDEERWKKHEIVLHESSPLYSVITLGGRQPNGFTLVRRE